MTTKLILIVSLLICSMVCAKEPFLLFRKGQHEVAINKPLEFALCEGVVRGGYGPDIMTYQVYLKISFSGEDALRFKAFSTSANAGKIDIFLLGEKIASPYLSGEIDHAEVIVRIPSQEVSQKIRGKLRAREKNQQAKFKEEKE